MTISVRLAVPDDVPVLVPLMQAAIEQLQQGYLDEAQIESSKAIMGIDRQLIDDGTYFVVEIDGAIAGCGGWSRRATMYGGDHSAGRDAALLDPSTDPARVRAMYTHPAYARRGVGRRVLDACEAAALAEGFTALELVATRSGRPLYESFGFEAIEDIEDASGGVAVPLTRMRKRARPPWMRHESPWRGYGFVHAVADDSAQQLADDLAARGSRTIKLRGEEMTTPQSFWAEIRAAFELPDYTGENWDAFDDSFSELELGPRTVVLWRRADMVAQRLTKLFSEAVAVLEQTSTELAASERKQLIIVLSGEGDSFAVRP